MFKIQMTQTLKIVMTSIVSDFDLRISYFFPSLVPRAGLEPAQSRDHEILSLARIPISPPRPSHPLGGMPKSRFLFVAMARLAYSFLSHKKMSPSDLLSPLNLFDSQKTLCHFK